jgi:hypothetical protein
MGVFYQCIYETLIFRCFSLAYPISLYFLYENKQFFSFFFTLGIIALSLIYFIFYYMIKSYEDKDQDYNKDKDKDMPPKFVFFGKEYLLLIIGYLVQINLAFLDAYEIKDGKINLNVPLFILKILMILETLKRIYFYICAIKLLFVMECNEREDCIYEMTFEIVYEY